MHNVYMKMNSNTTLVKVKFNNKVEGLKKYLAFKYNTC